MKTPNGFYTDNPALPLVQALISYWGITSAIGAATGLTLVCADLANEPGYGDMYAKLLDGPAAGQERHIATHVAGTLTVDAAFTNAAGAAVQVAAGTRFVILSVGGALSAIINAIAGLSRPLVTLYEGWQDELGIDPTVWTVTNPATGAAWARGAVGELLMAAAAPNANENARLRSVQRWVVSPFLYGTNKILRKFSLEFEMHMGAGLANLDNVNFFMGLTSGIADVRTTNNVIGFALIGAGNALQTVTDAGGAETVNTGFGENLVLTNKFKIEASLNSVKFYLNEVQIANHVANAPDLPMYLNFYVPTGAGGAAIFRIGALRVWFADAP